MIGKVVIVALALTCCAGCGSGISSKLPPPRKDPHSLRPECLFRYGERVRVAKGFYRGTTGELRDCDYDDSVQKWTYRILFDDEILQKAQGYRVCFYEDRIVAEEPKNPERSVEDE